MCSVVIANDVFCILVDPFGLIGIMCHVITCIHWLFLCS